MEIVLQGTNEPSELMRKLLKERAIAREYQKRRHETWNEIYELYRNRVHTNRLTQRQTVNIPLMKETVKTLLSKIDDPPTIDWKERNGDQLKEMMLQEIWNDASTVGNFEGVDILDKKNVLLYGRGFKKLNFDDGRVTIDVLDIYDVVIDPLVNPLDIETARFIVHQNIFRSLREVLTDKRYDDKAKEELKIWLLTKEGMMQSAKNREEYERKMERMKSMGVNSADFPLFAAGDVILNLCEQFTNLWNTETQEFERRVITYADDRIALMNETLEDLLGVDFWPFITWGEDMETTDFWSDGPADLVRVPNKVINIWFSQLVENRTIRNFQMHWFDASIEGYSPQTYEAGPGRMLPAPGNPKEVIMPVEIDGLDETMNSIDFLIRIIERGTAATSIEKGVSEKKQITLGEVEMLVGKAMERTIAMAKFYRRSWQELAQKWEKLIDANLREPLTLYKLSNKGKIWPKLVYPSDWRSSEGYLAMARSSAEQEDEKTKAIQRYLFLLQQFPGNQALVQVAQRHMLDLVELTPEEAREVIDEQKKMMNQQQSMLENPLNQLMPGAHSPGGPMVGVPGAPQTAGTA